MVLATADTITHHTAASTAAAIHLHHEGEVVETPLGAFTGLSHLDGVAVLAPEQGIVELFPADGQPLDALAPVVSSIVEYGWRVGMVVPTHRIGDGHRALRGRPVHLQSWWADGDHICFGGPEVP